MAETGLMKHQWKFWLLLCSAQQHKVLFLPTQPQCVDRDGQEAGRDPSWDSHLRAAKLKLSAMWCHKAWCKGWRKWGCGMGVNFWEDYCSDILWALIYLWEEMSKCFCITCGFFWPSLTLLLSFLLNSKVFLLLFLLFCNKQIVWCWLLPF